MEAIQFTFNALLKFKMTLISSQISLFDIFEVKSMHESFDKCARSFSEIIERSVFFKSARESVGDGSTNEKSLGIDETTRTTSLRMQHRINIVVVHVASEFECWSDFDWNWNWIGIGIGRIGIGELELAPKRGTVQHNQYEGVAQYCPNRLHTAMLIQSFSRVSYCDPDWLILIAVFDSESVYTKGHGAWGLLIVAQR